MALGRRTWIWIGLVIADVAVWLVADSQGNVLLAFNATGASLTLLQVLWVVSLFGFILLVLFGVVALVRAQLRRSRVS
jgi:hypothetical protein